MRTKAPNRDEIAVKAAELERADLLEQERIDAEEQKLTEELRVSFERDFRDQFPEIVAALKVPLRVGCISSRTDGSDLSLHFEGKPFSVSFRGVRLKPSEKSRDIMKMLARLVEKERVLRERRNGPSALYRVEARAALTKKG